MLLGLLAMLALTRAEIVQRMRTPVVTQADGLVRVFANCPDDMQREFQGPVARSAAETVSRLYRAQGMRPLRFERPRIIVHLGDVRTNIQEVVARATTNDSEVTTRIYLKSPGGADVGRFRAEVARAFYRAVVGRELSPAGAEEALRAADPASRTASRRARLEAWLAGDRSQQGAADDEAWDAEHLALLRKVIEVGVASRRDVRTFASRLRLRPPYFSEPFAGGVRSLTFREAVDAADGDARIRALAAQKAVEVAAYGGGRSAEMTAAAGAYVEFLEALSAGEKGKDALRGLLLDADARLAKAWEESR